MLRPSTTLSSLRAQAHAFCLLTGATTAALHGGSALAGSATATLNCQGETGTILAGSWKTSVSADKTEAYLANGLLVTHPGSTVDVTMTFDKNPERACFDFDLLLNDLLLGREVANLDFAASSEVLVNKGTFTQTYRLTLPTSLPIGEYGLSAQLGAYSASTPSGTGPTRIKAELGNTGNAFVIWDPRQSTSPTYASDAALGYTGASEVKLPLSDGHVLTFKIDPYLPEVMSATMEALKGLSEEQRRSPTLVYQREISYQANNHVLWGRWDSSSPSGQEALKKLTATYEDDSKKPWEWSSSTEIFKSRTKYGQSWVFACATVSMARALGIPTRPVTNIGSVQESAGGYRAAYHPTSSPTIATTGSAVVFSSDGKGGTSFDAAKSADKVWNFHVWTEAFHTVSSSTNTGWNAYDGTCQEMSDGRCQCGPGSLDAIKKTGYDGPFIAGETNADIVVYLK